MCEICDYARSQLSYEERQRRRNLGRYMLRGERVLDPHRFQEMVHGLPNSERELHVAQRMLQPLAPELPDWHRPYASEPVLRDLTHGGQRIQALQFWGKDTDPQSAHQWLWPVQGLCKCWQLVHPNEWRVNAVVPSQELWPLLQRYGDGVACRLGKAGIPRDGFAVVVDMNHWEDPGSQHYRVASVVQRVVGGELVVPARFVAENFAAPAAV
jgi:hypothetical protein